MCAIKKLRSCSYDAKSYSCFLVKFQAAEKLRYANSRRKHSFVFIHMALNLFFSFGVVFLHFSLQIFGLLVREVKSMEYLNNNFPNIRMY